ncbi:hypothetical protein BH10ACT11_BH10ACT11_17820 [soil metagenome]
MGKRATEGESGQATPEWLGLILLVSLLMLSMAALGIAIPGLAVGEAIASKLVCAAGLGDGCGEPETPLDAAYGDDVAGLVAARAPELRYEDGMHSLPVDFRRCRQESCADGPQSGEVGRSFDGESVTAFTHVVDCRGEEPDPAYDCSGDRAGSVYVHYFLYWPTSATSKALFGDLGYHDDDWEGFQIRVDPRGTTDARASSHHGYNYGGGPTNWLSDAGVTHRSAWGKNLGTYDISGGSHAGHVDDDAGRGGRFTPGNRINLVPLESLSENDRATKFAITPPWTKPVYDDPEDEGT